MVDGTVFVKVPGLAQQEPGKRWVRADREDLAATDPAGLLAQSNPMEMIRLFEAALDFEEDGETEVRGEPAERWRGTIDLAELAGSNDPGVATQLEGMGISALPAEVAIDGEGRLVQVSVTLAVPDASPQQAPGPGAVGGAQAEP